MLSRFSFENFRSFKDINELLMIANDNTSVSSDHIFNQGGLNLLQGAVIYGPNASGKSNFVKAINFASSLVLLGETKRVTSDKLAFLIDDDPNQIGFFRFDLVINKHRYSYTIAVNYQTSFIEAESLFCFDSEDQPFCLFERGLNDSEKFEFRSDLTLSTDNDIASRFNIYQSDYANPEMARNLFLYDVVKRIPRDKSELSGFIDVFNWFSRLIILSTDQLILASPRALDSEDDKRFLETHLKGFDTGISALRKLNVDLDIALSGLPNFIAKDIKEQISMQLFNEGQLVRLLIESLGMYIEVQKVNGAFVASKIVSEHKNTKHLFEFNEESDGTKRLFGLLPLSRIATSDSLIIIDELDRSLHTQAVAKFVQFLYAISNNKNCQFIVTTHDDNLLAFDDLRDDEIWFVDRDRRNNSSSLYSLDKFIQLHNFKRREDYLSGRFKALPTFDNELVFG